MRPLVLRGDARSLPLPDASVDLIVTSPPYWALRDYRDGEASMAGQIGSEATPAEWLAAMVECTAEWARVLKPSGSMFVNLGDKFSTGNSGQSGLAELGQRWAGGGHTDAKAKRRSAPVEGMPPKCLLQLPARYAIAATDQLGLILRRDIIWSKPNGLPESVTDRCRSSHEYVFHLVRQPRYYAAVDEIREPHTEHTLRYYGPGTNAAQRPKSGRHAVPSDGNRVGRQDFTTTNPLGKLPGSVWDIPSQPLTVPARLGIDHFAAFPMELPRRCILGWSPPGVCVECGEGRRPVADRDRQPTQRVHNGRSTVQPGRGPGANWEGYVLPHRTLTTITGYACACTPYTDHAGTGGSSGPSHSAALAAGDYVQTDYSTELWHRPKVGPRREYHFDGWTPPPTRPAIVLDPFAGTGTVMLVASALGRIGVGVDRSADYCRLAKWRTTDPGERARALEVPKPPKQMDGQESLWA